MSQHEPIEDLPRRDDESTDREEPSSDAQAGELSFDDLRHVGPGRAGEAPAVHALQKRVESALHEPSSKATPDGAPDDDDATIERWPPQVQMLCIVGGSALCWAVILTPFLLL